MAEVIHHSTQHVRDDDLRAIATHRRRCRQAKTNCLRQQMPRAALTPHTPDTLYTSRGGLAYAQFCGDCHRADGGGVNRIFPPLAGNPTVSAKDPATLLHIILTGGQTAATAAHPRVFAMPGFARLSDQELAEILSFVRTSWGHGGTGSQSGDVQRMRATLDPENH